MVDVPMTGDTAKIANLRKQVGKVIGIAERIAPACASAFTDIVKGYFRSQTDPYGKGWKPLKTVELLGRRVIQRRDTGHAPLMKSFRLYDNVDFLPFGKKVRFWMGVVYARYHISTGRRFAPQTGRPLPNPFTDVIASESEAEFKKIAG